MADKTAQLERQERVQSIKATILSLMWLANRQFSQHLQTYGLTHPQFVALASLVAYKQPCTMRDLTDVTFQDPPTMTGIIDRLVRMKLVQRKRAENDRRVVLVEATNAGAELVQQIRDAKFKEDCDNMADFSDVELDALEQFLTHLLRRHMQHVPWYNGDDVDREVDKLRHLINDPIYYMKEVMNK